MTIKMDAYLVGLNANENECENKTTIQNGG